MGKTIITIGLILVVIGLLLQFTNFNFNWFGKLPGDLRIEKPGYSFYFPITSMILISILGSVLLWIIKKINL
ncbi:MAG TPA: DUF2905 domain-containing protein [Moheibacter sp.]|nr:DUF2905 domain-containing protein [Moheibacter sp.]